MQNCVAGHAALFQLAGRHGPQASVREMNRLLGIDRQAMATIEGGIMMQFCPQLYDACYGAA